MYWVMKKSKLSCPIIALFKATRKGFRNVNLNFIDHILMFLFLNKIIIIIIIIIIVIK